MIIARILTEIGESPNGLSYSEIQRLAFQVAKGRPPVDGEARGYWATNFQRYLPGFTMKFEGRYFLTEAVRGPFTRETATERFRDPRSTAPEFARLELALKLAKRAAARARIRAKKLPSDWQLSAPTEARWYLRDALRAFYAYEDAHEHYRRLAAIAAHFSLAV